MSVPKRLRFEIFRRDNHCCRYCGAPAKASPLTVDHVLPIALGGQDTPDNLVTACMDCNSGKAASNPDEILVDDVAEDARRWSAALEQASAIRQRSLAEEERRLVAFTTDWSLYVAGFNGIPHYLPADWESSLARFYRLGLTEADVLDAVRVTGRKKNLYRPDGWRYFCGVCWSQLRELQQAATEIVRAGEEPVSYPQVFPKPE